MVIKQAAGSRQQAAGSRQQAAGSRQHILDSNINSIFLFNLHSNILLNTNNLSFSIPPIFFTKKLKFLISEYAYQFLSLLGLLLASMLTITSVNSALSATTVATIEGSKPYLLLSDGVTKLTNVDELLAFDMPKRDGSSGTERIDGSVSVISSPIGMRYSDIIAIVEADGQLHDINGESVGDQDGDADIAANNEVVGQIKATWYNGATVVPPTDLQQMLSVCGGPYKLTFEAPNGFIVKTKYGSPRENDYGGTSLKKTYFFVPGGQVACYFKPKDMDVLSPSSLGNRNFRYPDGYNSDTWEYKDGVHYGFKWNSGFPKTAFKYANFSIVGPGNDAIKFLCSSKDSGRTSKYKIFLNGCNVSIRSEKRSTFMAGGKGPTIDISYNAGTDGWVVLGSYTIPEPEKWALGKRDYSYKYGDKSTISESTTFAALDQCRTLVDGNAEPPTTLKQASDLTETGRLWRQKYLFRRDEFSNTPVYDPVTFPEGTSSSIRGFYSRDVGTFMGEWGDVSIYVGSIFYAPMPSFWTSELWSNDKVYAMTSEYSLAMALAPNSATRVACRG